MFNWVDFVIAGIFVLCLALEIKRGLGKAAFDFIALILTVKAAPILAESVAKKIQLSPELFKNEAYVYAGTFIVIAGIMLLFGKLISDTTLISLEPYDTILGGLFGLGAALIFSHVFVRAIAMTAGPGAFPPAFTNSTFAHEIFTFETYHSIVDSMYNIQRH